MLSQPARTHTLATFERRVSPDKRQALPNKRRAPLKNRQFLQSRDTTKTPRSAQGWNRKQTASFQGHTGKSFRRGRSSCRAVKSRTESARFPGGARLVPSGASVPPPACCFMLLLPGAVPESAVAASLARAARRSSPHCSACEMRCLRMRSASVLSRPLASTACAPAAVCAVAAVCAPAAVCALAAACTPAAPCAPAAVCAPAAEFALAAACAPAAAWAPAAACAPAAPSRTTAASGPARSGLRGGAASTAAPAETMRAAAEASMPASASRTLSRCRAADDRSEPTAVSVAECAVLCCGGRAVGSSQSATLSVLRCTRCRGGGAPGSPRSCKDSHGVKGWLAQGRLLTVLRKGASSATKSKCPEEPPCGMLTGHTQQSAQKSRLACTCLWDADRTDQSTQPRGAAARSVSNSGVAPT